MVQIYILITKNVSLFINCIKVYKILIESFNEISLIRRSVNSFSSYWFGSWQIDFKENILSVIRE